MMSDKKSVYVVGLERLRQLSFVRISRSRGLAVGPFSMRIWVHF